VRPHTAPTGSRFLPGIRSRVAEFAGSFAASHAPLIARDWEHFTPELRAQISGAYDKLGERIAAAKLDILVEIAPDHWVNFFLKNLPSVCIGVGSQHNGPPEPFMRVFDHPTIPGAPGFALHLQNVALIHDFEPSVSYELTLDHGFCIPLWRTHLDPLPKVAPIIINDLEPPMVSIARCIAWGKLIASAIASYPGDERIGVLASGGLSHSIGEPTMGAIDEPFDRAVIAALAAGDEAPLVAYLESALASTGNGAHEVRNWVVAHAAAGSRGFELLDYQPVPEVYVGCAWAVWNQ
jgi:aromatic ring-opening dioxygenase catalytic subunit (LigB family)